MAVSEHEVVVETAISAPPQCVWELVTDIALMPRFSAELQRVEWAEGFETPGIGAQFLGVTRHPAVVEWTTRSHVIDVDPPRSFGWAVGDPESPAAIWRFVITPDRAGSRLSYTARLGPGRSGVTMLIERDPSRAEEIVAGRLEQFRAGMADTIAGIKEIAEAPGRSDPVP